MSAYALRANPTCDWAPVNRLEEFVIVCLCADWCGVCRDYASGFGNIARQFPAAGFHWLDIELHADDLGDLEVENFPTLLIKRRGWVLFYGTMPPFPAHMKRTLEAFVEQSAAESQAYAFANVERRCWQKDADLQRLGSDARGKIVVQASEVVKPIAGRPDPARS